MYPWNTSIIDPEGGREGEGDRVRELTYQDLSTISLGMCNAHPTSHHSP